MELRIRIPAVNEMEGTSVEDAWADAEVLTVHTTGEVEAALRAFARELGEEPDDWSRPSEYEVEVELTSRHPTRVRVFHAIIACQWKPVFSGDISDPGDMTEWLSRAQ